MTTSVHHTPRWPIQLTRSPLWFSEWVVRSPHLILGCSLSQSNPLPPQLLLSLVACLLLSPALGHYLSFDFLLVNLGWSFIGECSAGSMTQSTAMPAEDVGVGGCGVWGVGGHTTGAHLELCHCPPEQTQREREAGEKPVGKPSTNWWRSAGGVTADVQ